MLTIVTNAGNASPIYSQFTDVIWRIIIQPTRNKVHPVAHGGMDAKIGTKKMEIRKQRPVVIAERPVRPPSVIPAPDSMNAGTGEHPKRDPMEIDIASTQ
jgi:hypothetical protein